MGTLQLPRATTFLRSLESKDHLDVEKEFVKRRLSGRAASSSATFSAFSESLVGPRRLANKEQRDALDAFVAACKRLTGSATRERVLCFLHEGNTSSLTRRRRAGELTGEEWIVEAVYNALLRPAEVRVSSVASTCVAKHIVSVGDACVSTFQDDTVKSASQRKQETLAALQAAGLRGLESEHLVRTRLVSSSVLASALCHAPR